MSVPDEDCHASTASDRQGLSPGAEVEPHDRRFSGIRGDHPGASGGGTAVQAKVGVDVIHLRECRAGSVCLNNTSNLCSMNPP